MKSGKNPFRGFCMAVSAMAICLVALVSCSRHGKEGEGSIVLHIDDGILSVMSKASSAEVPDTNDFILEIFGPDGSVVYSGLYGNSPETVTVPAGSCNVKIRSCEFSRPQFACPQYGDDQCVVVPSGGEVNVTLNCRQVNSGVKLNVDKDFLTEYPAGALLLKSSGGSLVYAYSEKRVAYFLPGNISLVLTNNGKDEVLMTRGLAAQEVLVLNVGVSKQQQSGGGITVQLDTSRIWSTEDYVIGGASDKGSSPENAMSVAQARACAGKTKAWVSGYIVGGDLTSSATGISFTAPFKSNTNIAIAAKSSVIDKSSCISVQLSAGDVRDALNLVSNPSMLGRQVLLCGDIVESYFGLVGIKNITEYRLK
ncbi:MAG: DUF6359 domain-containing protein [Bacteroidales bacterium]|nr:DUF6359 domain-containing protein [Bacteroidales bacterium]